LTVKALLGTPEGKSRRQSNRFFLIACCEQKKVGGWQPVKLAFMKLFIVLWSGKLKEVIVSIVRNTSLLLAVTDPESCRLELDALEALESLEVLGALGIIGPEVELEVEVKVGVELGVGVGDEGGVV
jgi:hypothetical protein